jgi:hypothetical protein
VRLFSMPEAIVGRASGQFARAVAHSTVRASFRQFFPTSAATLVPERTLEAIRSVWSRYHDWGEISSMPVSTSELVVRLVETLRVPALCEWTFGLIEQLLILSGATDPQITHEACEARGDEACLFRASWQR